MAEVRSRTHASGTAPAASAPYHAMKVTTESALTVGTK
jgi:hypothetical protein